jgi:hypothetical protein
MPIVTIRMYVGPRTTSSTAQTVAVAGQAGTSCKLEMDMDADGRLYLHTQSFSLLRLFHTRFCIRTLAPDLTSVLGNYRDNGMR